jgi:hypothetical protein
MGTVFVLRHYVNARKDASAKTQAHGYLDYLTKESEATRDGQLRAFDREGNDLSPAEAHAKLDGLEQPVLTFAETLSPDPKEHDSQQWSEGEWQSWTQETLQTLEERHPDLEWAVHHQDTEHPHVQLVLASNTPLRSDELEKVRETGDREAERIHERHLDLERDPMQELYQGPGEPQPTPTLIHELER